MLLTIMVFHVLKKFFFIHLKSDDKDLMIDRYNLNQADDPGKTERDCVCIYY